ncbi:MAG TPA: amidase [Actinomycetota bacterium]|nr:amidase [Actinomycetota bacterium]
MSETAFEFAEATITDLGARMAAGELTSARLTEAYVNRIEALDRRGPELRSVIGVEPDAVDVARSLDAERAAGRVRGPLHGIPILIKDNIETAGALPTTAGSLALGEARATRDATLVARLRDAGAVILGKANLSEWANFRSTRSSSGWSAVGGQGRNPYALDRNPCGSSSGSGAAVAANLCAAAIGTETDGSIVCPSSINGIVGIKPTVGAVSRAGVVPISHTQDTPGPMARTVADAMFVLEAVAGADERDPATRRLETATAPRPNLNGVRIGVARNLAGFHPGVDARFEEAIGALRSLGAEIADPVEIPHANALEAPELEVLLYEFKADLEAYLAHVPGAAARTMADLIAFNRRHATEEMPFFGQEIFEQAAEKGPLTERAYLEALATCARLSRGEGLDAAFKANGVEVVVAPTNSPAWLTDHVNGDHYVGGNSSPAAVAGYPSVPVPMGDVAGLPVGISFLGRAWRDAEIVAIAEVFERETRLRRTPTFAASVDA